MLIESDLNMVKVSFIVPVYNTEKYLSECLDTLVQQTLQDIEIICINDGSTDSSAKILAEYAQRDTRICVISQPNSGLSVARNIGIHKAKGEYLLFMDSDDRLKLETAKILYKRAAKDSLDVLFYNADCFADSLSAERRAKSISTYYRRSREYADVNRGADLISEMRSNGDYLCSSCFELWRVGFLREAGLQFTPGILHEDTEFTFCASLLAKRASHINAIFFNRRVRDGSTMSNTIRFESAYGAFRAFLGMERGYRRIQELGQEYEQLFAEMHDVLATARIRYAQMEWMERKKLDNVKDAQYRHLFKILVADPVDRNMGLSPSIPKTPTKHIALNENVKVSVIIPIYNMGKFLAECLDSVLGQTLKEIEVICVDDGSTDNSPQVLNMYASRDSRVKVISQKNQGVFAARNNALDVASGGFVIFMDPDDWYCDVDALRTLYIEAVANKVKICGGEIIEMLDHDRPKPLPNGYTPSYKFRRGGFIDYSDYQYFGWYTRFLFNRMMLEDNSIRFPPYTRYQDPPFMVRAMLAAGRFYALKRTFYAVRVEHKTIDWRVNGCRKLVDFMAGNADIFRMAREHGMDLLTKRQKENLISTGMLAQVISNIETPAVRKGLSSMIDAMGMDANIDLLCAMQSRILSLESRALIDKSIPISDDSKRLRNRGLLGRVIQCYHDEGLIYTLKRILVLGRK